jgi:hypothetical protein
MPRPACYRSTVARLPASFIASLGLLAACAAPAPRGASADARRPSPRCQVHEVEGKELTQVVSRRDGYSLLLPGDDWDLRCGTSVALDGSSGGPLHASVLTVEVVDPVDHSKFLRWLYAESADDTRKQGLDVSKASLVEIDDCFVLSYEVVGASIDGTDLRILHALTSRQRPDGTIYAFHVSWVGPAESFEPAVAPGLQRLATGFHLLPIN